MHARLKIIHIRSSIWKIKACRWARGWKPITTYQGIRRTFLFTIHAGWRSWDFCLDRDPVA